ncbi:MAG: ATP-binding cassette, subfamily bacterial CvaB/MchF/RaxB [Sphingomonadales bacterium]|jgi:ATP-binding cassette subfamily B protein RaxB|nr:ATP-binding cassette, subfamily bacterial CvaB/MchF/RaxB [Sphingomonadales bacterium]
MSDLQLGFWSRSRVRLVRQTEISECGLACLAMVANFHGLHIDLGSLRRRFQPSSRGAALKSLIAVADQMGFAPRAVRLPLEEVANLNLPAILHWDLTHYVVIEKVARGKALIHNPEGTSKWYRLAELSDFFTGVALELRPADNFEPADKRDQLKLSQLWRRVSGLKRALIQTLVLSVVLQAFVLASPYYMQVAIDQALPALDHDLLTVLALGFGLFTLIHVGTTLLRSFVLLAAGTSLSFGIAANIARKLFRLPVSWFEKRHVGDVLSRFQSIQPIQDALTQGTVAAVVDGMLAVLTLAVMFFYSATLALIALVSFSLYLVVRLVSFSFERQAREAEIVTRSKEQSTMIESLRGITTLRLFNREVARHALWQTKLTDAVNAGVGSARIGLWQAAANSLIVGLESVITIWVAIGFVISGGFSIGMVFAYLAYKAQFMDKAASLIDQAVAFRMLRLHLERLSDIAKSEDDVSVGPSATTETELAGRIELKGVIYRYSATDPVVLNGIDLTVEPGEHIAITGPSGGGKSTLVKILLGLIEPDMGEMLVDGQPLSQFGYKSYHEQVGAVLQDDSLFAGSLADNIALFDDSPDMERIHFAAAAAAVHDDIMQMPMGYGTLVGDMGSTLSGGQKQRVLLARALYKAPRLLVMDEGTAHLDARTETIVNQAIAGMGITRIVIAHRAETISAADRIYFADRGKLVELDKETGRPRQEKDQGSLLPAFP